MNIHKNKLTTNEKGKSCNKDRTVRGEGKENEGLLKRDRNFTYRHPRTLVKHAARGVNVQRAWNYLLMLHRFVLIISERRGLVFTHPAQLNRIPTLARVVVEKILTRNWKLVIFAMPGHFALTTPPTGNSLSYPKGH